jgi:hypothetical protein
MAVKTVSSTPKNIPGAPKVKLPTMKTTTPKPPKLSSSGLGGYLQVSKLLKNPIQPKNGLGNVNLS